MDVIVDGEIDIMSYIFFNSIGYHFYYSVVDDRHIAIFHNIIWPHSLRVSGMDLRLKLMRMRACVILGMAIAIVKEQGRQDY